MKLEINVPDSLREITLGQYQKFQKLELEDNAFGLQKMIEIFCGLDLKDVATIKYKSVQQITLHLNKIFDTKHSLIPTIHLNGQDYGFIPELDDMSLGEYIDLENNMSDWQTMHKAMSILYRPITFKRGHKYQIEEYKGVHEEFTNMPLDVVFGAQVFFYNLANELLTTTLNYIHKEEEMSTALQQHLERNGVGINQSMDLLRGILPSLMR